MSDQFINKYAPESWSAVQGNNSSIDDIQDYVENYSSRKKPRLMAGDRGTGKTTTAKVASEETGYPLIEINASSARKTEDLQRWVSQINNRPMNHEHQIVFIDEADSLSEVVDLKPLYDALENPSNPVLVAVNKKWEAPDGLTNRCKVHDFKLQKRSIKARLRDIVEAEDIDISKQDLGKLATRGDLRSAIQDLQAYAEGMEVGWNDRDMELGNFSVVDNVLRGKNYIGSDMYPSDLVLWLDENLSKSFDGLEEAVAYDALSQADIFSERAGPDNGYRYWTYTGALAEQTANLRKTEPYDYINKSFPSFFRSKKEKYDDGSPESKLYQKLKDVEGGRFEFGGDYVYFKNVLLPTIRDCPESDRKDLAVSYGLEDKELEAIGLDKSEFEDWKTSSREIEEPDTGISDL